MGKLSIFVLLACMLVATHANIGLTAEPISGDVAGTTGERALAWPVQLIADGKGGMTAIQVDLDYDPSDVEMSGKPARESARPSDKSASFSTLFDGNVRTVVYGRKETTIPDGTVFEIQFDIPPEAGPEPMQPTVKNPIASEAQASKVMQEAGGGSVTVAAAADVDRNTGSGRRGCFIQTMVPP
jgi:hypothetical protein